MNAYFGKQELGSKHPSVKTEIDGYLVKQNDSAKIQDSSESLNNSDLAISAVTFLNSDQFYKNFDLIGSMQISEKLWEEQDENYNSSNIARSKVEANNNESKLTTSVMALNKFLISRNSKQNKISKDH